jgi:pyruvate dehydrogenase E2 component (dihydrolipoamide acetyltransferase)
MTEKVTVEITAPVAGIIISLEGRNVGDIINVGEILVKIDTSREKETESTSEEISIINQEEKDDSLFTASTPFKRVQLKKTTESVKNQRTLAAPSIRREARENSIDLHEIQGTGPGGRITREDFNSYSKSASSQISTPVKTSNTGGIERIPLRGLRRTISQAMRNSKDMAAHYTYFEEVDMSALDKLRLNSKQMAEKHDLKKLSYLPLVIKCLIPALKEFPYFNASLDDSKNEIILKKYYNIGIAVNTDQGLIVPVIRNADQKSIWEIAKEIQGLADKARNGKLALDDVSEGTFTITSVGNIGGVMATPIIRHPEVAILGLMRSKLRPVVVEENGNPEIAIRPIMYLSLSIDHRVVDGAVGAMFTNTLIRYMENPGLLLLNE